MPNPIPNGFRPGAVPVAFTGKMVVITNVDARPRTSTGRDGKTTQVPTKGYDTIARLAEVVVVNGLITHLMPLDIAVQLSAPPGPRSEAEFVQNHLEKALGLKR